MRSTPFNRRRATTVGTAFLAVAALGLGACGGEEEGEQDPSSPTSAPAESSEGQTSPDSEDQGSGDGAGESSPEGGSDEGESGQESPSGESGGEGGSEGDGEGGSEGDGDEGAQGDPGAGTLEPTAPEKPANQTFLEQIEVIKGDIRPKSVVSNDRGRVIANNMMYQHTMTLYDAQSRELVDTVSDTVDLDAFGKEGHGEVQGAPVEAVFTKDGATAYVTNYQMYGKGFSPHGGDLCEKGEVTDHGYIYELDVATGTVTNAIEAGAVPKYAALSPDEKTMLVSNWCDFDLSVIDVESGKETGRIPLGRWARGIAFHPDGHAYATAMGTPNVYKVDLEAQKAEVFSTPGQRIRHVITSPDGKYVYVVASGAYKQFETSRISKLDAQTGEVLGQVHTGNEPRSMDISGDGTALYVVNYYSNTMSKVDTETMEEIQEVPSGHHPIGITYDDATHTVWMANYVGSIQVFDDTAESAGSGE